MRLERTREGRKKLRACARILRYLKAVGETRAIRNLTLVGFMGTGKSSVGQLAAAQLRFRHLDTDSLIEEQTGKTISRIFAEEGEAHFREYERLVVAGLARLDGVVIAAGGGLVTHEDNLSSLKRHALVVCLWSSPETIWERVKLQTHRPLLQTPDPLARIRQLLAEREPFYRRADVLVNTELRSVKDVAHHVVHQFRLAQNPGAR